jgi:methyl-accepting chemotaxis protein
MDDIASVARQVSTGSSQTLAAARDLSTLSEQLGELVGSFKLEESAA